MNRITAVLMIFAAPGLLSGQAPSERAQDVAEYAVATYFDSTVATLADLMRFRTVAREGLANAENPEFNDMTAYLREKAARLGFDFEDHGAVVVIGLGGSEDRLGIVTHGDVQPADPDKWARDPFSLDTVTEPGRLLGRGAEDDKGPIATALYAMKALVEQDVPLRRRVELIISYTEESDWEPFQEFLERNEPPALSVAIDAEYPVVVAEKGWCAVYLSFPLDDTDGATPRGPHLTSFTGGAFLTQIPEDARATLVGATQELEDELRARAERDTAVAFELDRRGDTLVVRARGRSAHSSKPEDGRNAITHLAALLGARDWTETTAGRMVRLVNDLVGTGHYAERFGDLAYSHEFMGPLTLSLTTLELSEGRLTAGVNLRRPVGRSSESVERSVREAVEAWKRETGYADLELSMIIGEPYLLEDAPHIPALLEIFRHYTGREDAAPLSIGGGTHARLMPAGVNFGPAMPDEPYTGHTEHEFMRRDQFRLNLRMYTAMLVELAGM